MGARSLIVKCLKWAAPLLAGLVFSASPTLAHGSLTMEQDICKVFIGGYQIHFAGYQPYDRRDPSRFTEFCEDIPAVGHTFVVLDLIDPELRTMPIAVRVVEDRGQANDDEAPVVFEVPEESHPTGSFSYRYTFDKPGRFVGLITAGNGNERMVARFPFSVGRKTAWWVYAFIFALGLVAAATLIKVALRRHDRVQRELKS